MFAPMVWAVGSSNERGELVRATDELEQAATYQYRAQLLVRKMLKSGLSFYLKYTKLIFKRTAPRLTQQDIIHAEEAMDITLPPQFIAHYTQYNGGIPSNPYVLNEDTEEFIEISIFFPLHYKVQNSDASTVEKVYDDFKRRCIIPADYLPFAQDWGGNLFCIHLGTQQVVFILMDMGAFTEDCVSAIALSFDIFLAALVSEEEAEE